MTSQTIARREYCWIAWQKLSRREWFLQRFLSSSLSPPVPFAPLAHRWRQIMHCDFRSVNIWRRRDGKKLLKNFLSYCYFMAESGNNKRKLTDKKTLPSVTISARIQKSQNSLVHSVRKMKANGMKKSRYIRLKFTVHHGAIFSLLRNLEFLPFSANGFPNFFACLHIFFNWINLQWLRKVTENGFLLLLFCVNRKTRDSGKNFNSVVVSF